MGVGSCRSGIAGTIPMLDNLCPIAWEREHSLKEEEGSHNNWQFQGKYVSVHTPLNFTFFPHHQVHPKQLSLTQCPPDILDYNTHQPPPA